MSISDDELDTVALAANSPIVTVVDGEVVVEAGLNIIVMSSNAALDLARRITEAVRAIQRR